MKQTCLLLLTVLAFTTTTIAQSHAKVVAVVTTASWCPVCEKHAPRMQEHVFPKLMMNDQCSLVMNDITDDASKAKSKEALDEFGIYETISKQRGTGMIYFVNAGTGEVISKISVSKGNEDVLKAFDEALASKASSK